MFLLVLTKTSEHFPMDPIPKEFYSHPTHAGPFPTPSPPALTLATSSHPFTLHKASYFFWNQGFEKQKSQTGLLQSLLYQILRHNPELAGIANITSGRLNHEMWDFPELKSLFERVIERTEVNTRFCFFIDGLDRLIQVL